MHKKWRKKLLQHKNTQAVKRSLIALYSQEVQTPICKKPQEVTSPTANRKYPQEVYSSWLNQQ